MRRLVWLTQRADSVPYVDWLPNHILIIFILLLFSVLNPLAIPFGLLYFSISTSECLSNLASLL